METIRSIQEWRGSNGSWMNVEAGYQIETTHQVVTLAISDESACCESWGYFLTEDDTRKFIGAELRGVKITETNRSTKTFNDPKASWDDDGNVHLEDGDVMFVDIETDRGPLQFVAYNSHNGYYGHRARVQSDQLKHEVTL